MKIFVSDYDGTFNKHNGKADELKDNIAQVNAWRRAGNIFIFATGRPASMMNDFAIKGLKYDYLVALNGGIVTTGTGAVLSEYIIPHNVAIEIMALVKEQGFVNYSITDGFTSHNKSKLGDFMARWDGGFWHKVGIIFIWIRLSSPFFKNNIGYTAAMQRPIAQIAIITNSYKEAASFAALINQRFCGQVSAYVNETAVDICLYGLSKATGIADIAERSGINHPKIYCMGDSYNDIPMLENYHGFTFPGAPDEVKATTKGIYSTVGDALKALL